MPNTDSTRSLLPRWDWPTIALLGLVVALWGAALALPSGWGAMAVLILVPTLALHSSLSHELLHGHPFGTERAETTIGLWQPGLFIPYLRFKRTHLAHHRECRRPRCRARLAGAYSWHGTHTVGCVPVRFADLDLSVGVLHRVVRAQNPHLSRAPRPRSFRCPNRDYRRPRAAFISVFKQ